MKQKEEKMNSKIEAMKALQADAMVFYMKLHNYHWNVKGLQFVAVHNYTEELYEQFTTIFDDLAELVLQSNEKPLVTLAAILKAATVKEDSALDFGVKDVLAAVRSELEYFYAKFKELKKIAEEDDDDVVVAYCDEKLSGFRKAIWFLNAQLA
jgi:starvation-inducible DNA-binding protein